MYRPNTLKKRLGAGNKAFGCWLFTGSPAVAEIVGLMGFDFVLIDLEHGAGDLRETVGLLQALGNSASTTLVRVAWNDPVLLKRALDTGVEGVMIPMIESADEARAAVAACRYPPAGTRGRASSVRAADYGLVWKEYSATANENLLIICQIESAKGVANIAEIGATDGVDVLFIGPNDLAGSLGQADPADIADTLAEAEAAIKKTGKIMGTVPHAGLSVEDLFAKGYDMVAGTSDTGLLRDGARRLVAAHRKTHG